MDKEIEVGEYVRTKDGFIAKITEVDHVIWFDGTIGKISGIPKYCMTFEAFKDLELKHSKNINDLLKPYDLVFYKNFPNSERLGVVKEFLNRDGTTSLGVDFYKLDQLDITMILTKEQIEFNAYRIQDKILSSTATKKPEQ